MYEKPYIDESGLHISTYQDTLDDLIATYKGIYGQDVYLGTDSADYQWIAAIALKKFDSDQAAQLAYNSRSPQTATGAALDAVLKLNGIARNLASYSTCGVTLTGTAGTVVNNGVVSDVNGNKWDLPVVVTIGGGGTVDVTATCQTIGAITALVGNINIISTPTAGWTSVTNAAAATPGQPVETEVQVKARQADSVSLPSQTLVAGTDAAIAAIDGVLRRKVYENPTDSVDANGVPRHSIACVVEGGTDADIAQAIFMNKAPGCGLDGEVTVVVTDPITLQNMDVKFHRPTAKPIFITINVTKLSGWTTTTSALVKFWVAAMINSRGIGDDIENSFLYWAAMNYPEGNPLKPAFSISSLTAGLLIGSQGTSTLVIGYDEVAQGDVNNIVINEV